MLEKPENLILEQKKIKKEIGKWYKEIQVELDKYRVLENDGGNGMIIVKCEKNRLISKAECARFLMMTHAFGEKYWNEKFDELADLMEKIKNYPN